MSDQNRLDCRRELFNIRRFMVALATLPMLASTGQATERLAALAPKAHSANLSTYVIERELPGAGKLSADELWAVARKSREVLDDLGPGILWIQSYVADDKIYCVYEAQDTEIIRRHAELGGFPVSRIRRIHGVIGPEITGLTPSDVLPTAAMPLPQP